MNGISNIVKKELTRVFQDKKLVVSLFVMPVILIIGIYMLMGSLQSSMHNDIKTHIPVVYVQNAPEGFTEFVKASGFGGSINSEEKDTDLIKTGILKGTIDLLVDFEPDFAVSIKNYKEGSKIPEVKTYYNPSEDYSSSARTMFFEKVLTPYKEQLLTERIGSMDNIQVFYIDLDAESSVIMDEEKASGKALGMMLPYLITMLLFAGAMGLGVDAIAGEKERGTLASMLITPVKRSEIVMGKLISLSILSSMSAAVYAISMVIAMPMMLNGMSGGATEGMIIKFSVVQILQLLAIMLSLVFLYVGIISLVAVFSRTSKEANTYVSPIYIIVIVAGMVTMFQSGDVSTISYAIPIYGSAVSIQALLVGELTAVKFLLTIGGTVVISAILTFAITKAFNSEKVMFNA